MCYSYHGSQNQAARPVTPVCIYHEYRMHTMYTPDRTFSTHLQSASLFSFHHGLIDFGFSSIGALFVRCALEMCA